MRFWQTNGQPIGPVLALILTTLSAGLGCRERGVAQEPARASDASSVRAVSFTAEQIRRGGVRWVAAESVVVANSQELPGELLPNEDRTVRLSAPARGRIVAVHAEVGDHVRQGQELVTLQSQDATTARADFLKAVADLHSHDAAASVASAARERADRFLLPKAGSRQDAERARADEERAQSDRRQAEAEVERARASLDHLSVDAETGGMRLRTNLAGIVLAREAVPGAVVDAGTPLVVVADLGTLWLSVSATEAVASTLRPGAGVRFTVPAYPSETFETRVTAVAGAADPATRTLAVRALVSNTSRKLRPAMFATVWIDVGAPDRKSTRLNSSHRT